MTHLLRDLRVKKGWATVFVSSVCIYHFNCYPDHEQENQWPGVWLFQIICFRSILKFWFDFVSVICSAGCNVAFMTNLPHSGSDTLRILTFWVGKIFSQLAHLALLSLASVMANFKSQENFKVLGILLNWWLLRNICQWLGSRRLLCLLNEP